MTYAPIARILIRYAVGAVVGPDIADTLSGDPDVITIVALAIGAITEVVYGIAKRKGWAT